MANVDKDTVKRATPIERLIPEMLGEHAIESGGELKVRCPWHEDNSPSLRINAGKGVWRCDPCNLGGDAIAFVQKFRNIDFVAALAELAGRANIRPEHQTTPKAIAATYDYRDTDGTLLYQTVRYAPKDFRQRRPVGTEWAWNLEGVRRVPYRLPDLLKKQACVVVEGEKDADTLWTADIPATCNVGGAGKWREEYARALVDAGVKRVIVLPDHDDRGRDHAERVAHACHAAGIETRILPVPGVPPKGDISDFLETHTVAELRGLLKACASTAAYAPTPIMADVAPAPSAAVRELAPPAPLSTAAYHGLIGEVVQRIAPHTEADPAALLVQLLTMFGNVIGRTAHFQAEADTHYLNLNVGLVGLTAKGRKGVSIGHARHLFEPIDPAWVAECQKSGLSSGEGLIWAVRDPIEKQQPIKERGRVLGYETVIDDPGVSDKRLLVIETELASTLRVLAREGNTLSALMRQAWDGLPLRTLTKNSPAKATGAHISVIAHITADELRRYLDATEQANGFGNRFLWVYVQRARELPEGGGVIDLHGFAERMRGVVEVARTVGLMPFDANARALWHQRYGRLSAGRPGLLGSMTGRAEAQVRRLACLYALSDRSAVVRTPDLWAALEVWRYCFESARFIFGQSLGDPVADEIARALHDAPAGLTRTEIGDRLHRHVSASAISRALTLLAQTQQAQRGADRDTGGRPAEYWIALRETDDADSETLAAPVPTCAKSEISAISPAVEAPLPPSFAFRAGLHAESPAAGTVEGSRERTRF